MADGIRAGFYFVAFVDLLGQRAKLAQFNDVAPKTDEERAAFQQLMADTAGVVRNERESIARWLAEGVTDEALTKIPLERREEFAHIITRTAFQTGFSDSFVVAFPLQVDGVDEHLSRARSLYDVWTALLGLSVLSLASLAQEIPWRAGIDVGIGMQIFPNEVYGPVLYSAYKLESTVAECPRLVLGRGLLDYLTFIEHLPPTEPLDAFAANMAADCRQLICGSEDGWPMLHILSPVVMKTPGDTHQHARTAAEWISKQVIEHWKAKDEKLFRRYTRLDRYFRACAPVKAENP
jgi:hypothetical protein